MKITGRLEFVKSVGPTQEWMVDGIIFTVSNLTDSWIVKQLKRREHCVIGVWLSDRNTLLGFRQNGF